MPDVMTDPPRAFVVGSTLAFKVNVSDYPAPTWVATFALIATDESTTFVSTDNGDGQHLFQLTPADTTIPSRLYRWQISVTDGAELHVVRFGTIDARPNYAEVTGGLDDRSHAARIFDAINHLLEGKAKSDESSLSVGGRSLSAYTWEELVATRGYMAHQMTDEERMARGYAPRGPRTVRFVRP